MVAMPRPSKTDTATLTVELAFWERVKDSKNLALLEAYLQKRSFAPLAKIMLDEFRG
jgi:hypothetical protein